MARKAAAVVKEGTPEPEAPPIITGNIEIEVGDEAAPPAPEPVEIETSPEPAPPAPVELAPEPEEEPEAEPEPPQDSALQQRLQELIEAARLANEREQAAQEQLRQANARERQAQEISRKAQYDAVVNGIGSIESTMESLRQQNREAWNNQDPDRQAEISEQLGAYSAQKVALEQRRATMDQQLEQIKRQQAQQPKQQQPPAQQQQPQRATDAQVDAAIAASDIPQRAQDWLRAHRDYMRDQNLNNKMQWANEVVQDELGAEASFTDAYFDRMEVLLRLKKAAPPQQPRTAPILAPTSREAPSMSTGKAPSATKVTLDQDERQIAQQIALSRGISQKEAETIFAREKLKMKQLKANGSIS